MKARGWNLAGLAIGLLLAVLTAALAFVLVPGFKGMYAPVARQLPWQTRALFSGYAFTAVLPLAVLGVWWGRRGLAALMVGVMGSALVLAFATWAVVRPELIHALMQQADAQAAPQPPPRPQPPSRLLPSPLTREQALQWALATAARKGYVLADYELMPTPKPMKDDGKTWFFMYVCKPPSPIDCGFDARVDRTTGEVRVDPLP